MLSVRTLICLLRNRETRHVARVTCFARPAKVIFVFILLLQYVSHTLKSNQCDFSLSVRTLLYFILTPAYELEQVVQFFGSSVLRIKSSVPGKHALFVISLTVDVYCHLLMRSALKCMCCPEITDFQMGKIRASDLIYYCANVHKENQGN